MTVNKSSVPMKVSFDVTTVWISPEIFCGAGILTHASRTEVNCEELA